MSIIQGSEFEKEYGPRPQVIIALPPGEPPIPANPMGWRWKLTLPIAGGGVFECEQQGAGHDCLLLNDGDIELLKAHLQQLRAVCWSEAMAAQPSVMTQEQAHALTINQVEETVPPSSPWWKRVFRC